MVHLRLYSTKKRGFQYIKACKQKVVIVAGKMVNGAHTQEGESGT